MSFANDVKIELAGRETGARHCLLAELAALIMCCGRISRTDEEDELIIVPEHEQLYVIQRFEQLVEAAFGLVAGEPVTGKVAVRVLQALKMEEWHGHMHEQDRAVSELLLQSNCCKRAFLAGVFICQGTMSSPKKSYHMEMMCSGISQAEQIAGIMRTFEIEGKITLRKNNYVVYVKEADRIADLLTLMQAMKAVMDFENVRVEREIKGNINRRVNCETANITKTVAAAVEQVQDIELIRDTVGLNTLSKELYDTAMMRLYHEDASLKDLGAMMEPPVGKSGMNHRFQKLKKLAEEVRSKEGRFEDDH